MCGVFIENASPTQKRITMNKCNVKFESRFSDYLEEMNILIKIAFPKKEVDNKLIERINTWLPIFKGNNIILKPYKKRKEKSVGCWKYKDEYILSLSVYNKKTYYNKKGEMVKSIQMRMDSKYSNKEYEYFFKKNGDLVIKNIGGITFRIK